MAPAAPEQGATIRRDPSNTKVDITPPAPSPPASRNTRTEDPPAIRESPPSSVKSTPAKREDLPYGISIPGRKGYVFSPFSDKQQVDVTGIPTGTKVKCPYTGKVFRVP